MSGGWDGVLPVDKPGGLTSHDVVAAARRALRERRIGHTGTLDPLATGVLPLACGRATRLARFLSASEKEYEADIRFGLVTDTFDTTGREVARSEARPAREAVVLGLESLTGRYLQTPPAYSAKKVAGERAYAAARRDAAMTLAPVPVTVHAAELLAFDGDRARVRIVCSAGFYVRAFAQSLGELVGTGACLAALRRTRSGEFGIGSSAPFDALGGGADVSRWLVPMDRLLSAFPAVTLDDEGRRRVSHGQEVDASDAPSPAQPAAGGDAPAEWVRLLDVDGRLVAVARPGSAAGSLHPTIVLI